MGVKENMTVECKNGVGELVADMYQFNSKYVCVVMEVRES